MGKWGAEEVERKGEGKGGIRGGENAGDEIRKREDKGMRGEDNLEGTR